MQTATNSQNNNWPWCLAIKSVIIAALVSGLQLVLNEGHHLWIWVFDGVKYLNNPSETFPGKSSHSSCVCVVGMINDHSACIFPSMRCSRFQRHSQFRGQTDHWRVLFSENQALLETQVWSRGNLHTPSFSLLTEQSFYGKAGGTQIGALWSSPGREMSPKAEWLRNLVCRVLHLQVQLWVASAAGFACHSWRDREDLSSSHPGVCSHKISHFDATRSDVKALESNVFQEVWGEFKIIAVYLSSSLPLPSVLISFHFISFNFTLWPAAICWALSSHL